MTDLANLVSKMADIRSKQDLAIRPTPYLRQEIEEFGVTYPMNIRYYQIQGIYHLILMNRFLLGDDTGLGKCVSPDTWITTKRGILRASEFHSGYLPPDTFVDVSNANHEVVVRGNVYPVKQFYDGGVKPTVKIRTRFGFELEGSYIHPIKAGNGEWQKMSDLRVGDTTIIHLDNYFPTNSYKLSPTDIPVGSVNIGRDWGFYIGMIYAAPPEFDHLFKPRVPWRFYQHAWPIYDKILPGVSRSEINTLHGQSLRSWLRANGICPNSLADRVPSPILQSKKEAVLGFLSAFVSFKGRENYKNKEFRLELFSESFSREIHHLLWKVGVLSHRAPVDENGSRYWRITMNEVQMARFQQEVGFVYHAQLSAAGKFAKGKIVKPVAEFADKIVEIELRQNHVVDLEVNHESHTFIGNGFECHNTLQSIAASCFLWEKDPEMKVIVVTIKSAVQQWSGEFDKFTNGVKVFISSGLPKKREAAREAFQAHKGSPAVLIIGYGSLIQDIMDIKDWSDYMLIVDEASAIKNSVTQTHKIIRYMSQRARRVVGLTATMIENNLLEGWALYNALVPGLFGNRAWFMQEFCVTQMQKIPGSLKKVPVVVGYKRGAITKFKESVYPYFMGRSKLEVAKDLPSLTRKTVFVGMTPQQDAKYQEAISGMLTVIRGGIVEEKKTDKLSAIIYCQQITNHPQLIGAEGGSEKLDALMELLTEGDLANEKVIVYSRFKTMIDLITQELSQAKIGWVRITGDENEKEREASKVAFQDANSDARVICITSASRQGVNLQAAKAIIFFDTPWSAGDFLQILGRMIRIGSKHDKVFAIHLVAENTIDGHVQKKLSSKIKLVESVLGQRMKGEATEEIEVLPENDISNLYDALVADAKVKK